MYSASIFSEAGVEAEGVGSLMLRNGMIVAAMRFIVCGEVLERMRRIRWIDFSQDENSLNKFEVNKESAGYERSKISLTSQLLLLRRALISTTQLTEREKRDK